MFHQQAGPHPAHRDLHPAPKAGERFCVPLLQTQPVGNMETLGIPQDLVVLCRRRTGCLGALDAVSRPQEAGRIHRGGRIGRLNSATNEGPTTQLMVVSEGGISKVLWVTVFQFDPSSAT